MEPPIPPPSEPEPSPLTTVLQRIERTAEDLRLEVQRERETREEQVRATRDYAEARHRADRRSLWAMGAALTAVAGGLVVAIAQNVEDRQQQAQIEEQARADLRAAARGEVERCKSGNERVLGIRNAITTSNRVLIDALAGVAPANPRTAEEQAAHEARVAAFRATVDGNLTRELSSLTVRDCSPKALGLPDIPPEDS